MPSEITAEEFCAQHGNTFCSWLKKNTVECACKHKYSIDEDHQTGGCIDCTTILECRRCFVPVGMQQVSRRPTPCPALALPSPEVGWGSQPGHSLGAEGGCFCCRCYWGATYCTAAAAHREDPTVTPPSP